MKLFVKKLTTSAMQGSAVVTNSCELTLGLRICDIGLEYCDCSTGSSLQCPEGAVFCDTIGGIMKFEILEIVKLLLIALYTQNFSNEIMSQVTVSDVVTVKLDKHALRQTSAVLTPRQPQQQQQRPPHQQSCRIVSKV